MTKQIAKLLMPWCAVLGVFVFAAEAAAQPAPAVNKRGLLTDTGGS
jgi:hypothetical protein